MQSKYEVKEVEFVGLNDLEAVKAIKIDNDDLVEVLYRYDRLLANPKVGEMDLPNEEEVDPALAFGLIDAPPMQHQMTHK
mmetsp:Transcript_11954/g.18471  ORF Transcript_11954/g.18471 Transcript_11954/m.18471 type:complete len:80 (+) Transcript_11954:1778-2017(+)